MGVDHLAPPQHQEEGAQQRVADVGEVKSVIVQASLDKNPRCACGS